MFRTVFGLVLAGGLIAGAATGAQAFLAEDPEFALRGAGAASLTYKSSQLGPVEIAIRERLVHAGRDGTFNQKRDGAGVAEFYAQRDFRPVWTADGRLTPAAIAVAARLGAAGSDGLDPAAYLLPAADIGTELVASPVRLARTEAMLSLAVARYVREAYAGRVDPSTISESIDIHSHLPDPIEALAAVAAAPDPAATMAAYNPPHEGYRLLREALAQLRAEAPAEAPVVLPEGKTLKPGMTDARVLLLRARLQIAPPDENPDLFDEALVAAVKAFQASQGLTADGAVGPNTLSALNGPGVDREAEVIANMERWRWLPRDLGWFNVQVNIPEFLVRVRKNDAVIHTTRVVVGKPSTQTPIFSDEIEHTIVNPYWHVPQSIIKNEMLPAAVANPGTLNGYEVFVRQDGRTHQVDPYMVNWAAVSASQVSFRQPPGTANALGRIKFMFPNSHDVYLHDTPAKSLFQRDMRAYSHGCIRVLDPMAFAEVLFSEDTEWDAARLTRLFGSNERRVDMSTHVPVHITYFTAVMDDAGVLQLRRDIYGHSAKVRAALGL